jgi:hypothetical protein
MLLHLDRATLVSRSETLSYFYFRFARVATAFEW